FAWGTTCRSQHYRLADLLVESGEPGVPPGHDAVIPSTNIEERTPNRETFKTTPSAPPPSALYDYSARACLQFRISAAAPPSTATTAARILWAEMRDRNNACGNVPPGQGSVVPETA